MLSPSPVAKPWEKVADRPDEGPYLNPSSPLMSLALRPNRRGHLTLALIEGLLVSLALFAFMLAGKALVLGEHVSPGVAAWSPIIGLVMLGAGMWLESEGWLRRRA